MILQIGFYSVFAALGFYLIVMATERILLANQSPVAVRLYILPMGVGFVTVAFCGVQILYGSIPTTTAQGVAGILNLLELATIAALLTWGRPPPGIYPYNN